MLVFAVVDEPLAEIRYKVPASWKRELKVAAKANGITLAALMRIRDREYLRGRYESEKPR